MSVAWVYGVVGVHPWLLALLDDRAAQDIWGKDDTTLICSSLMPVGVATPVDGGFRLSGRWKYASGCEHCDWAFLGGMPPAARPDERRIFLVPAAARLRDRRHLARAGPEGHRQPRHRRQGRVRAGLPHAEFADNFRGVGPGLAVNTAPLYRLPFGQVFFRGVSTGAIGALQGMLDAYLDYGKKRVSRASATQASEDPLIQLLCAETAGAIDEMKTILHRNFRTLEAYAARGEMPPLKLRMRIQIPQRRVAERCSLLAVAAVQGGPARPASSTTSRSAASWPTSTSAGSTSPTSSRWSPELGSGAARPGAAARSGDLTNHTSP